jgi:hypothetical protein
LGESAPGITFGGVKCYREVADPWRAHETDDLANQVGVEITEIAQPHFKRLPSLRNAASTRIDSLALASVNSLMIRTRRKYRTANACHIAHSIDRE